MKCDVIIDDGLGGLTANAVLAKKVKKFSLLSSILWLLVTATVLKKRY